jgi:O-antigen ligase
VNRPVWALHVLVVGLALHNLAMAELWDAGLQGRELDVVSAWKEVVILVALVLAVRARGVRRLAAGRLALVDWLAVAFGAFLVLYAVLPQSWLDGGATRHGVLLALRHDGLPLAAYALGRLLELTAPELRRLYATILATAAGVAAFGLVDVYAIPLQWWRESGAPGWFGEQLGFSYEGLSGLAENFVYNTGNEEPLRRVVSTFLSPLATSYLLVVALLVAAVWLARDRLRGRALALWIVLVSVLFAGLLWTHSRSSYLALALGLAGWAVLRRGASLRERVPAVAAAVAVVAAGAAFVAAYPDIGPATRYTDPELEYQRAHAQGGAPAVSGVSDASTESHWKSLRDGVRAVVEHPQGLGLGNAGSTAARTNVTIEAGESTYTEIAVETGLLGGLVFAAWSLALLARVARCSALVAAIFLAVLALALQTDVIGVPWLVVVVWALAGSRVTPAPETARAAALARGPGPGLAPGRGTAPARTREV